jgi:hypothetical protein
MRIYCTACGHKGRIGSRDDLDAKFAKLYCQCLDPKCGHTWVANLTFSHTLSPSAQSFDRLLFDRLKDLPRAKQRELFDKLGTQAVA